MKQNPQSLMLKHELRIYLVFSLVKIRVAQIFRGGEWWVSVVAWWKAQLKNIKNHWAQWGETMYTICIQLCRNPSNTEKQIWTFIYLFIYLFFEICYRPTSASSRPLWVRFSKPLTLQTSTPHHCENWCFWAAQSGVEHSRAENIRAQQRTERQAHPPLEGSNLYHLTLKDLWV